MKYGNIAKSIAFGSLWIYAAIASSGVASFDEGAKIWFLTVLMSFAVIFLFDKGPERKKT